MPINPLGRDLDASPGGSGSDDAGPGDNPLGRGSANRMFNPIGRGPGAPIIRRTRRVPPQVIPNANVTDRTGQVRPNAANALANDPARNQLLVASLDAIIPILYGGPERLAGKLYIAKLSGNVLYLHTILCEGEVEQIGTAAGDTSTNGIFLNDVDLAGGASIVVKKYVGTAGQGVDPTLAAVIQTPVQYNESLPYTAYVVAQVPAGTAGFPRLVYTVKGRKVYDPRQNLLPQSNLLSSWSQVGTCPAAQTGIGPWGATSYAWVLTDDDVGAIEGRTIAFSVVSSALSRVWSVKVRKTSGGTSKTVRIDAGLSGGTTPVTSIAYLNTDTGATSGGIGVTVVEVGQAADRHWLISGTVTDNASGNNAFGVTIYPAVNNNGVMSTDVAATGSATICEVQVRMSTVPAGYIETPTAAQVNQPTVWSDNPALCLGDYLASTSYGEGRTVNAASLAAAAEFCDEMLGAVGQPNEKRARVTILLDSRQPVKSWRDILRSYVPCWVVIDGGQAHLRIDRDEPSDHTIVQANIRQQPVGASSITFAGLRDTPNAVIIGYTDTTVTPHKMATAEANTGASPRRVTRIDMPGLRSFSAAKRMATLKLNHYTLEPYTGTVPLFDEALKVLDADIITITDADLGLAAQKARVLSAADEGHGRWLVTFRKHDPAAFTNAVVANPTTPTTGPPNPNAPPAITGLALTAERVLESGVWVSRIRATWNPLESTWPFVRGYIVELFDVATNATYTWSGGVIEVASTAHGLALNDVVYLDFTTGGASIDGGYSIANVPNANAYRTTYAGSGAGGNVTWRKMREHHIVYNTSSWLSQPILLGVNYSVRVRAYSTTGVVGP